MKRKAFVLGFIISGIIILLIFCVLVPRALAEDNSIPSRIIIDSIGLDSIIFPSRNIEIKPGIFQHEVHPTLASWHEDSAKLIEGNTVINGHNFSVFRNLHLVKIGDSIIINNTEFIISQKLILKEKGQSIEKKIENAKYIMHTNDIRLTLITCFNGNNDRLIIIAFPK